MKNPSQILPGKFVDYLADQDGVLTVIHHPEDDQPDSNRWSVTCQVGDEGETEHRGVGETFYDAFGSMMKEMGDTLQ